jgi:hypothetical protein
MNRLEEPFSANTRCTSRVSQDEIRFAKSLRAAPGQMHELARNLPYNLDHRQILSTALRIQEKYYLKGYYCFLHANEPARAPLNWFVKRLIKRTNPAKDAKLFQFMRSQNQLTEKPIESFLTDDTHDHRQRNDLISVDAYFLNDSPGESANYFCLGRRSVYSINGFSKFNIVDKDVLAVFEWILGKGDRNKDYALQLQEIMDSFASSASCGNFYVFCIPQSKINEMVYRSHEYGPPCQCTSPENDMDILNDFQKKQRTPHLSNKDCYQYRILSYHLTPENGVRSFLLTPNPAAKSTAKQAIGQLIDTIIAQRGLDQQLPSTPTESNVVNLSDDHSSPALTDRSSGQLELSILSTDGSDLGHSEALHNSLTCQSTPSVEQAVVTPIESSEEGSFKSYFKAIAVLAVTYILCTAMLSHGWIQPTV